MPVIGFSYDTFFDLRTEKFVFFLLSQAGEKYYICYEKSNNLHYYHSNPMCNLKILEGNLEYGFSIEIYKNNIVIIQPNSKEELRKIIEIIRA